MNAVSLIVGKSTELKNYYLYSLKDKYTVAGVQWKNFDLAKDFLSYQPEDSLFGDKYSYLIRHYTKKDAPLLQKKLAGNEFADCAVIACADVMDCAFTGKNISVLKAFFAENVYKSILEQESRKRQMMLPAAVISVLMQRCGEDLEGMITILDHLHLLTMNQPDTNPEQYEHYVRLLTEDAVKEENYYPLLDAFLSGNHSDFYKLLHDNHEFQPVSFVMVGHDFLKKLILYMASPALQNSPAFFYIKKTLNNRRISPCAVLEYSKKLADLEIALKRGNFPFCADPLFVV